ncbi:CrcB family protein [Amnibacterium sp. CER49]|uniref:CrcB family protein n=1 Tax=Amnibacterium sp. CER49 TaxID=3039161 RepID=UPI0024494356|nr:CrcB family protein [Amnibacterium sp. CER49]MDH2444750.1 CrcB family protein [Amnibacterium sp. CER49]
MLAVVLVGGTVGTAVRAAIGLIPLPADVPIATPAINVAGAFALGLLLAALARRGPDTGSRRTLRLLLGTGLLGGFTTYSTLAVDTAGLVGAGGLVAGIGSALVTVIAGLGGAALGDRLGRAS